MHGWAVEGAIVQQSDSDGGRSAAKHWSKIDEENVLLAGASEEKWAMSTGGDGPSGGAREGVGGVGGLECALDPFTG
jgi:hypothetical protein